MHAVPSASVYEKNIMGARLTRRYARKRARRGRNRSVQNGRCNGRGEMYRADRDRNGGLSLLARMTVESASFGRLNGRLRVGDSVLEIRSRSFEFEKRPSSTRPSPPSDKAPSGGLTVGVGSPFGFVKTPRPFQPKTAVDFRPLPQPGTYMGGNTDIEARMRLLYSEVKDSVLIARQSKPWTGFSGRKCVFYALPKMGFAMGPMCRDAEGEALVISI